MRYDYRMVLVESHGDTSVRVRKLIRKNHLTQKDVAAEIGISQQLFTNKLHGRANYTLRDISRLAKVFDVSIDYLVGRSDSKEVA